MQYFDDIPVGQKESTESLRITRDEIIDFAKQWDPQPFHIDEEPAASSSLGDLTASGSHVFCIATRLTQQLKRVAMIAGLGQELRFPNSARLGDHLHLETECIEKRPSRSKPDRGIVVYQHQLLNQDETVVLEMRSNIMVAKRSAV